MRLYMKQPLQRLERGITQSYLAIAVLIIVPATTTPNGTALPRGRGTLETQDKMTAVGIGVCMIAMHVTTTAGRSEITTAGITAVMSAPQTRAGTSVDLQMIGVGGGKGTMGSAAVAAPETASVSESRKAVGGIYVGRRRSGIATTKMEMPKQSRKTKDGRVGGMRVDSCGAWMP